MAQIKVLHKSVIPTSKSIITAEGSDLAVIVKLVDGSKKWILEDVAGKAIEEILRGLGLNTEEYIVSRNGRVVTADEKISEGDEIILYPVVSGG